MRSLVRTSVFVLASATAGCTAIADPGSYTHDTGCDLDLELVGFDGPHQTQDLTIQLDTPPGAGVSQETKGLAMVVGIPAGTMHFQIPLGVHYRNALVDFFVDNTPPFETYNPQVAGGGGRGDHSWTLVPACDALRFEHVAQFDDFEEYTALDEDLLFDMSGFGLDGKNIELIVSQFDADLDAVDGDGDGRFTLAFQHTTNATDAVGGHFLPKALRGMLDRGADFRVEVWVDRDGDQVVDDLTVANDPADEGYVFEFVSGVGRPGIRIPLVGLIPLDASTAGTDDHSGTVGLTVTAP